MDDHDLSTDTITVALPSNIIAQIDAQVGGGFVDREDFVRSAARHYLEYLHAQGDAAGVVAG